MTVWEAHFGRRPNLNPYLIGPWMCLSGSTGDGASSEERLWRSRPDVKKEKAFGKWVYDESDSEKCECTPGEAGEKELGFVHKVVTSCPIYTNVSLIWCWPAPSFYPHVFFLLITRTRAQIPGLPLRSLVPLLESEQIVTSRLRSQ
jgi:hypothetical protein